MNKRKAGRVVLAGILSLALAAGTMAGCGSDTEKADNTGGAKKSDSEPKTDSVSQEEGPVEITWLTSGTDEDFNTPGKVNYECLTDFNNSQDKIHVNVEHYANQNDLFEVIQMKLAAGTAEYDVISVDSPMVPSYANQGWLLPVEEYFSEEELKDFTDTALESAMYDSHLYAPALQNSTVVLCYNTNLLKEAGMELRENDVNNRLTWEELVDYSRQALEKLDPDGSRGITGIEFSQVSRTYLMNMLPNSMGGAQIGEDGFTVEGVLDSEPWINALNWYQTQVNDRICSRGVKASEAPDNFYSDKSVFYVASAAAIDTISRKMDHFDYTCVPAFAGMEDKVATPCGSWNIAVNVNSEHADEAVEFIKYMTLGKGNELRYEFSSNVPARHSVLEELTEKEDAPKYINIAVYEAQNTAVLRAKTPGYSEYSAALDSMWEDIRNGVDIEESVKSAITAINLSMEQYK